MRMHNHIEQFTIFSTCFSLKEVLMAQMKGSKTEKNLLKSFAGESQDLQATVEFLEADITKFHCKEPFDIIISRDSFEHFARPQETLQVMTTSLKNGGRMYVGFSPLYYSPIGHHFEFGFLPPWGHCVIPEAVLCVLAARRTRGPKPVSVADVGLNKWTPKRFRTLFNTSRLRIVDYQINRSENSLAKLFSFFAWFPGVERFFTLGIYCVLEKP